MKLNVTKSGTASVIKVEDRMDAQSSPEFEKACNRLIQDGEKRLVVDLGGLERRAPEHPRHRQAHQGVGRLAAHLLPGWHGEAGLRRVRLLVPLRRLR